MGQRKKKGKNLELKAHTPHIVKTFNRGYGDNTYDGYDCNACLRLGMFFRALICPQNKANNILLKAAQLCSEIDPKSARLSTAQTTLATRHSPLANLVVNQEDSERRTDRVR